MFEEMNKKRLKDYRKKLKIKAPLTHFIVLRLSLLRTLTVCVSCLDKEEGCRRRH
jgi:hypothetical protein